jgi:hypothetical protein
MREGGEVVIVIKTETRFLPTPLRYGVLRKSGFLV